MFLEYLQNTQIKIRRHGQIYIFVRERASEISKHFYHYE